MRSKISEFSYGFALVNELLKDTSHGFNVAPVFPSLYQEGQANGGFDVFLNSPILPLFLQFKLTDYMTRSNADTGNGKVSMPFFRMPIRSRTKSPQHELLLELEEKGNAVYYVAPRFWQPAELDTHFTNCSVISSSAFIRPLAIGSINDDREHHVAFEPTADVGYLFSEPRDLKDRISFFEQLSQLRELFARYSFNLSTERASQLLHDLREIAYGESGTQEAFDYERRKPEAIKAPEDVSLGNVLEHLQFISRCYFGCEMLLLRNTP